MARSREVACFVLVACAFGACAEPEKKPNAAPAPRACDWRDCATSAPSPPCIAYCAGRSDASVASVEVDGGVGVVGVSPADASAPPSTSSYSGPLPPPKPTTLRLSVGDDSPGDKDIAAGDDAFEKGAMADATKRYEAARAAAPKRAAPLVGLARIRIARIGIVMDFAGAKGNKEVLAAAAQLREAVRLDPQLGAAYVELGRALLLLGDADAALGSLRDGVRLLPSEAEAHSALGVALLATGHGEESVTELGTAAQLDPGSPARHGNYATALFMRGRVKEAVPEYELQVRLADGDARAHSDLGNALLAANEVQRAVRELERAVQIDPKRATFHSNLGYALQIMGKLRDAIAEYNEALRIDDKLVSAWVNLATALARDPKTRPQARAALERAKKLDPNDPAVKANLAELDDLERDGGARPVP
jgi:tetratricopeptide (TPR) repeat protein